MQEATNKPLKKKIPQATLFRFVICFSAEHVSLDTLNAHFYLPWDNSFLLPLRRRDHSC